MNLRYLTQSTVHVEGGECSLWINLLILSASDWQLGFEFVTQLLFTCVVSSCRYSDNAKEEMMHHLSSILKVQIKCDSCATVNCMALNWNASQNV